MWSCARHVTIFTFKLSLQLFKKKKTKKKKKIQRASESLTHSATSKIQKGTLN
jgi:predicted peroxiredoxin